MADKTEVAAKRLAKTSRRVLDTFRTGHYPSFELLQRVERDLAPFEHEKICGHGVLEDCECFEGAYWWRKELRKRAGMEDR